MTAPEPDAPGPAAKPLLFVPERASGPDDDDAPPGSRHPAFRLVAAALLVAAAAAHNRLILWAGDGERLAWFAGALAVYGVGAWLVLHRRRRANPSAGDGALFPLLDLLPLAATVYVTGASRSWLFWAVLLLPADEAPAGVRRTAFASVLSLLGYLAALGVAAGVDGQSVAWGPEAGKLTLLAVAGALITLSAWRGQRDRGRLAAGLREARERAADVVEDYQHFEESSARQMRAASSFLLRGGQEARLSLRTMLRAAQLAESEARSPEQRTRLREVLEEARHLLDIVNEVIDLARVQSGSLARELTPVAVRPALDEVLEQAVGAADRRGITMPERAPLARDIWVMADERKLRQIFANLISNAIKYNHPGGRIDVRCRVAQGRLRVSVRDTGPGIPEDRVEAAFEPFDRLGAENSGVGGTGLGLPLVRSLVHAMNGQLGVHSEPGSGSTFWFELDVTDPADAAEPPADGRAAGGAVRDPGREPEPKWPEGDPAAFDAIGARVLPAALAARETGGEASHPRSEANHPPLLLYIDASPENATQLGRLLAHRPRVQMLWTPLGRQALEQAESRPPTLILLHLELLDIPAGEVLRQIRASPTLAGIPVVRVAREGAAAPETGVVPDEAVEGSLTTPYDGERVLSVLDEILSDP